MADEVDVLLGQVGDKSQVRFLTGTFRGLDPDNRAVVDFSGGRVPAYPVSMVHLPGEQVWVQIVDGVAYMHGPVTPKPDEGEVVSASGGTAELKTTVGTVTANYDHGLLLIDPLDIVHLVWGPSGAWIDGVKVDFTPPPPPPPPITPVTRHTVEFSAVDSGSYQSGYGWRTNEVWSSANNMGGWFYGSQISDTIPDTAPIISAQIYLPNPNRLLGAMPFGRHNQAAKPGGALTFSDVITLGATSGWVNIPTTYIDYLKTNPGGFGFGYGGYNIWPGTQRDGQSGRVRVTYDA